MRLADSEVRKRGEAYDEAKNYYMGDQHTPLEKNSSDEPDDNVIINLVKLSVDRQLSFLYPKMPTFEVDPQESEETEEERWFREAWEWNGGLPKFHEIAENGALSGHCYVRVMPKAKRSDPFPRLVNMDPHRVSTFWRADNIDLPLWHEFRFTLNKKDYLTDFIYRIDDDIWEIQSYARENGTRWEKVSNPNYDPFWRTSTGPIITWKNLPSANTYYGRANITFAEVRAQDSVNLMYSEMARINRYHSSPRIIVTGVEEDEFHEIKTGEMWTTVNENAKVHNIEMVSQLEAARAIAGNLYDNFLAEQRIVILRGEVKDFQRVTNAGVRTVFIDMLSKNNLLKSLHGGGVSDVSSAMNFAAGRGELRPETLFPDPLPRDSKERVEVAAMEHAAGALSLEEWIIEAGRDPKDTFDRIKRESKMEFLPQNRGLVVAEMAMKAQGVDNSQ